MGNRAEDEAIRRLDFARQLDRGQAKIGAYATRIFEGLSDNERAILRKRLSAMPLEGRDRKTLEELIGPDGATNETAKAR